MQPRISNLMMYMFLNHAYLYNCSDNMKYLFNYGFIILLTYMYQMMSGLMISLYYLMSKNGYISLILILNNMYYGYLLSYYHNNCANLMIWLMFIHIYSTLYYNSSWINNMYLTGYLLLYILMMILFLGYMLSWGQMSYWGATVMTSLLSFIPYLTKWLMGNYMMVLDTMKSFYIFHYLMSLISMMLMILHIYILHYYKSSNLLMEYINSYISLWLYILSKDFYLFLLILILLKLQMYLMFLTISHTDNLLEVNILVTPLHIIPEWYFLSLYIILKMIPSQMSGLFFIIISLNLLLLMENLYTISTSYLNTYKILTNSILLYYILAIWLGANLPTHIYISYGSWTLLLLLLMILLISSTKTKHTPSGHHTADPHMK